MNAQTRTRIALIALLGVGAVVAMSGGWGADPEPPATKEPIYLVRTTEGCTATATYTTPDGMEQRTVSAPTTFRPGAFEAGRVLTLSAQSDCGRGGVSVRVVGTGDGPKRAHSPAAYGVASVTATIR